MKTEVLWTDSTNANVTAERVFGWIARAAASLSNNELPPPGSSSWVEWILDWALPVPWKYRNAVEDTLAFFIVTGDEGQAKAFFEQELKEQSWIKR